MKAEDENCFRNQIRESLESFEEYDNDASKLYTKKLCTLKPTPRYDDSLVIELGEFKWIFIAIRSRIGTSLHFKLFANRDNNPRLNFYALNTVAIIHPLNYRLTECSDRFHSVCKAHPGYVFDLERACERGFLDSEGNVTVELQIQMFGENVFAPLLVNKYRTELFLASMHIVDKICSTFIENTKDNLKSKWSRFCTFMEESGQISMDQMFWEEQDVIKEALVYHFFVDGVVTSPLLMEILYNGYQSISANNTTAKFVRIEENRFGLVGDVPSLFNRVVGLEYKPIYPSTVTNFGCMIVEIFFLDYLFRNKIEANFTRSELNRTEKKSNKKKKKKAKPKKNDKCVEENKQTQNDESIAADLEEDTFILDSARSLLNYLFMSALKRHEVIATTLTKKIDTLIAEQKEHVARALKKEVTELYLDAQQKVAALYVEAEKESGENFIQFFDIERKMEAEDENYFRNEIRKSLESVEEDDNDASKLYTKILCTLKPTPRYDDSLVIELGEFKWIFIAIRSRIGTSLHFKLFADRDNNPRLNFYALNTVAIIHPLDYRLTECSDRFHSVCKAHPGYVFDLERACERGFLDAEGNVKVELQIQMFGENVFAPLLVNKYRTELFLASMHIVDKICSSFIENTKDNLKSKLSRFCTFMEESGQISMDQMFWEEQDVIKEALVYHFFVDGVVTSPLLMEILYNGYQSISANNTTAKFVRIEENRFGLVGDVPSLFNRVVGLEYKPIYESIVTNFGCMIVEIFVLDYLFRNKIEVNFTLSN
ncbi:unnamed protein product [Trifolium pratense]|uniref:Uncharacterized protein n=1 Tax=Trifolium pratense TaxID=57577 RepID=A0ACB0LPZ7_TRIPR|nr:unnamed protein product [Trifolium pratense]